MASDYGRLCIGTYTIKVPHALGTGEGIYLYDLNRASGELAHTSTTTGIANPSYVAADPQGRYLYAVGELEEHDGQRGGLVSAFRIDPASGTLTLLNQQPSHGTGACYLSVDPSGKWVLVANYNSGSIAVYPVQADGTLGAATATIQHEGSSINPARQEGPHAHCIFTDAASSYVYVADLGMDKVMIYALGENGALQPAATPFVQTKPGAGPRHLAWHPSGKYLFLINELDLTVIVYVVDAASGALTEVQSISTMPDGYTYDPADSCAAIRVHPSGQFVYGSNRGHDSIVGYHVDETTGRLTYIGHTPTGGQTPRDFTIDPTGAYLLAGNQNSHTVTVFKIHAESGELSATGHAAAVPTPAALLFTS